MKRFEGKVAVVTGAASGIGRALAVALAERGARLALSDVDEAGLEKTTRLAAARGAEIDTHRVDVSARAAVFDYAAHVVERFGVANLVINNAGVGLGATVREMSIEDLEWLMGINFWGVVYGTKAFLPHLERSGEVSARLRLQDTAAKVCSANSPTSMFSRTVSDGIRPRC